jgi:hypothetical protein
VGEREDPRIVVPTGALIDVGKTVRRDLSITTRKQRTG